MVVGIVLTISGLFLLINLIMDLLYAALDPRVQRDMKRLWLPAAFVALILGVALPRRCSACPIRSGRTSRGGSRRRSPGSRLGRDEFGRDVLSRLIWGARTSLGVAFASATARRPRSAPRSA